MCTSCFVAGPGNDVLGSDDSSRESSPSLSAPPRPQQGKDVCECVCVVCGVWCVCVCV